MGYIVFRVGVRVVVVLVWVRCRAKIKHRHIRLWGRAMVKPLAFPAFIN